jgi:hypothetical protein
VSQVSQAVALELLLRLAGLGQLALVMGSLAIPRVLGWRAQLAPLRPLIRQVFWTYAAYIWCCNLAFGLLSALGAPWLLDRSPLAGAVTGFVALYWTARVGVQFGYFDRADAPGGWLARLGEAALVGLFVALAATYALAAWSNVAAA